MSVPTPHPATREAWIAEALGPEAAALVARDAAAFFHQDGSSPCIGALRSAAGIWLEDLEGRRCIDLHGNTVHHLGHAHPRLVAALHRQVDTLAFSPRRYTNEPATALAEALLARWPGKPRRVLFATGGSDAIEIALRLALVGTGARGIVSLQGSYHGHGFGAMGLSSARYDSRLAMLADRHHVTPYWDTAGGGAERMVEEIGLALATAPGGIAAVIAEPMRSSCHVPPVWLWPAVRTLCDRYGARLIFDEIPSALGKTGRFFAFQHFGAHPDLVVLGKSLGGGLLPIAAVIADADLNVAPELNLGHYTHEKNPLTTAVALETLQVIEDEGLIARAAALGAHAEALAAPLIAAGRLGGLRGLGLLRAAELPDIPGSDRTSRARAAVFAGLRHGISSTTKPGGALGFSPPLIIREQEIALALARVDAAFNA